MRERQGADEVTPDKSGILARHVGLFVHSMTEFYLDHQLIQFSLFYFYMGCRYSWLNTYRWVYPPSTNKAVPVTNEALPPLR